MLCGNRRYAAAARERLVWELPARATLEVPVYTWHSLAYHLVSRYYPSLGFKQAPVLLTAPEQWGTVRELLAAEDKTQWGQWSERLDEKAFVDEVADFCLRAEQRTDQWAQLAVVGAERPDWVPVITFFQKYVAHLQDKSRLDYSGLIWSAVRLLEQDETVRSALKRRFPHVLVDDGEEIGRAQRALLASLDTSNLVVAADPDCGIETFRGAEPDWVLGFEKWFGPHATLVLGASHRIGAPLSRAVADLIDHNGPAGDRRVSEPASHPTTFECLVYPSISEEVEAIVRELRRLHIVEGVGWADMAVLVSQPGYLLAPLQRAMGAGSVPYESNIGNRPIVAEPAAAHFLNLVRVALYPEENSALLPELLTTPLIGLDYAARRKLERLAWQSGLSLSQVVEAADEAQEFRTLRDLVVAHQHQADECFWSVWSTSRYYRSLASEAHAPEGTGEDSENMPLLAFYRALERFVDRRHGAGSMGEYLSEAARADFGVEPGAPVAGKGPQGVSLVSFHGAKGRQWESVIVAGCLDLWIPKGRRSQGLFDPLMLEIASPADREVEAIADDRRTFYVAATRARSHVLFTASAARGGRARPSRFLIELAGAAPEQAAVVDLPPLTTDEMAAQLHRSLATPDGGRAERVAALIALSEVPGVDPGRWYGRWEWTPGSVPLIDGSLRTSYSRLGVFDNCGLQYVLQSVLGLDASSTYSMKFGTWIHALFRAVHEKKITTPAGIRAQYDALFDEKIFPNATMAKQFRKDGEKMLEIFWNNERDPRTVKAEHAFSFEYSGAVVRGRIDRVDKIGGTLKLTDYKTAKWAPSKVQAEKSLQLALYYLAALKDPELAALGTPGQARLVYPGSLWPDGRHKVMSQNAEQAEAVVGKLPGLINGVVAEDFRPRVEADCFFCKMKPLCPLWPQGQEVAI